METNLKAKISLYALIASLYAAGVGIWSGTIYLHMKNVGFNYSQINLFLIGFWIVTFIAELPSGVIADTFGRMKTVIVSSLIRALGLIILAVDAGNVFILLLSAILTGLGESLYSGSPDSWLVEHLEKNNQKATTPRIFSRIGTLTAGITLISGYVGANILGKINLGLPLIVGSFLLLMIIPVALVVNFSEKNQCTKESKNLEQELKDQRIAANLWWTITSGLTEVKSNKALLGYFLAFFPISFIVTGPFNQWQLYFPAHGEFINAGNILIGIDLFSIFGSFVAQYLFKRSTFNHTLVLMALTAINTTTIIVSVLAGKGYLSVIFIWLHVLVTSTDEISRYSVLQTQINSQSRSTLISLNNTIEAAATIIALWLNGFLSDEFGIGTAWLILAIVGCVFSLFGYTFVLLKNQKRGAEK